MHITTATHKHLLKQPTLAITDVVAMHTAKDKVSNYNAKAGVYSHAQNIRLLNCNFLGEGYEDLANEVQLPSTQAIKTTVSWMTESLHRCVQDDMQN